MLQHIWPIIVLGFLQERFFDKKNGKFLSADKIRHELQRYDIPLKVNIATFCDSGVRTRWVGLYCIRSWKISVPSFMMAPWWN